MSTDAKVGCVGVILLALMFPVCYGGCYGCSRIQTSDGYRDSTVRKLSETGVLWKTWEVETLGDGVRTTTGDNGTTLSPETFRYSVSDPAVLAKLRDLPPGKRIRIHYRKMWATWQPSGETPYFITKIDDLP